MRVRYQCSPYHEGSSLYPFVTQLRHAAGIAGEEPPDVALQKLERLIAGEGGRDEHDVAVLAELLAIPTSGRYPAFEGSPQRRKQRAFETLLGGIESLGRSEPVSVLFEDAHWGAGTALRDAQDTG